MRDVSEQLITQLKTQTERQRLEHLRETRETQDKFARTREKEFTRIPINPAGDCGYESVYVGLAETQGNFLLQAAQALGISDISKLNYSLIKALIIGQALVEQADLTKTKDMARDTIWYSQSDSEKYFEELFPLQVVTEGDQYQNDLDPNKATIHLEYKDNHYSALIPTKPQTVLNLTREGAEKIRNAMAHYLAFANQYQNYKLTNIYRQIEKMGITVEPVDATQLPQPTVARATADAKKVATELNNLRLAIKKSSIEFQFNNETPYRLLPGKAGEIDGIGISNMLSVLETKVEQLQNGSLKVDKNFTDGLKTNFESINEKLDELYALVASSNNTQYSAAFRGQIQAAKEQINKFLEDLQKLAPMAAAANSSTSATSGGGGSKEPLAAAASSSRARSPDATAVAAARRNSGGGGGGGGSKDTVTAVPTSAHLDPALNGWLVKLGEYAESKFTQACNRRGGQSGPKTPGNKLAAITLVMAAAIYDPTNKAQTAADQFNAWCTANSLKNLTFEDGIYRSDGRKTLLTGGEIAHFAAHIEKNRLERALQISLRAPTIFNPTTATLQDALFRGSKKLTAILKEIPDSAPDAIKNYFAKHKIGTPSHGGGAPAPRAGR